MPDKLTDAEVKKALECCALCKECCETEECQYYMDNGNICDNISLATDALDLINSLETENEKNENIIRIADKTIATLNAEIRHLDQESDILRADVENLNRICDEVNAENESLKAEVERLNNNISAMSTTLSTSARATRHEAYKEFAERLKEKKRKMLDYDEAGFSSKITVVSIEEIDNILNELVGDTDGKDS